MARTKNAENEAEMRKRLSDALYQMLDGTVPYRDISIKSICEKAGVSTGVFYYYYKNKDDALMHQFVYMDRNYDGFFEKYQGKSTLFKLKMAYEIYCDEMQRAKKTTTQSFYEALYRDGTQLDDHTPRVIFETLMRIFSEGAESGELRPGLSAEDLALSSIVFMRGALAHWASSKSDIDAKKILNLTADALINGLAAKR